MPNQARADNGQGVEFLGNCTASAALPARSKPMLHTAPDLGGKACVAAGVPSTSLLRPRAQPGSQRRLLLRPAPPGRCVGGAGPLLVCVLVRSEGLSPGQRPQGADAEGGDYAAPPAGLVDSSGRQMLACHSALREHVSSKSLHLPASQGPDEPRPLLLASLVHSPAVMSLSCPGNRAAP